MLLIVMDGIGITDSTEGNAVAAGYTPNLDKLMKTCPNILLKAHGTAVGLPSDADMGNSEVGHNAIGAGQVFSQGAKLVTEAIESGSMFQGKGWMEIRENCVRNNSTLHFIGLFSDGNVHSHIDHLKAMIKGQPRRVSGRYGCIFYWMDVTWERPRHWNMCFPLRSF